MIDSKKPYHLLYHPKSQPNCQLDLCIEETEGECIAELTDLMRRTFDDDTQKHLGKERGGPEGYDNGDFFRNWLLSYKETVGYKILSDNKIIGCVILWVFEHGKNLLGVMFIDPEYHNLEIGTHVWHFIEQSYPDTVSWTLDTPSWALRNHYFYEKKCGFQKMAAKKENEEEFFIYQKMIKT